MKKRSLEMAKILTGNLGCGKDPTSSLDLSFR